MTYCSFCLTYCSFSLSYLRLIDQSAYRSFGILPPIRHIVHSAYCSFDISYIRHIVHSAYRQFHLTFILISNGPIIHSAYCSFCLTFIWHIVHSTYRLFDLPPIRPIVNSDNSGFQPLFIWISVEFIGFRLNFSRFQSDFSEFQCDFNQISVEFRHWISDRFYYRTIYLLTLNTYVNAFLVMDQLYKWLKIHSLWIRFSIYLICDAFRKIFYRNVN